jgi:hypothetical protein
VSPNLAKDGIVTEKTILASSEDAKKRKGKKRVDPSAAWTVLGWAGFIFLVVGGSDFVLTWYPTAFGNREWEFGTVTASFNHLPIIVLGLGLLYAGALQSARKGWAALVLVLATGLTIWVLLGAIIWATNVPLALQAAPPEVMTGIKKALVKTAIQSLAYPMILGYMAWKSVEAVKGTLEG